MQNTFYPFNSIPLFQKIPYCFLFIFLFFTASSYLSASGTDWADNVVVTYASCGTGDPSCLTFTISNIPANTVNGKTHGYAVFWNFDDSSIRPTYYIDPNKTQESFNHTFCRNGPKEVILQMTKIYDDTTEPVLRVININNNINGSSGTPFSTDGTFSFTHSIFPRVGDTALYAFTFRNDSCIGATSGLSYIEYETDKVDILDIYTTEDNDIITILSGRVEIEYFDRRGDKTSVYYAKLFFKDSGTPFKDVSFTLTLLPPTSQPPISCFEFGANQVFALDTVKSHDPNMIIANQDSVCTDPISDTMVYTIVFQNIGDGPARYVKVTDQLPDCFLFGSNRLRMIEPSGLKPQFFPATREIVWEKTTQDSTLKGGYTDYLLRGTGEEGYIDKLIPEDDTKDSITFEVYFDPDYKLPSCGNIVNRAEIIFDSNAPIITNDFFTEIRCDGCNPCGIPPKAIKLDPVVYDGKNPVRLVHQGLKADYFQWYPSEGLDDPKSATPMASPQKDKLYTLVCSGGCTREIFQLPVIYDPTAVPPPTGTICYICCGLLLLPLFLFLKWKRKTITFWDFNRFKKKNNYNNS